jgi:hypothetical protein
VNGEPRGFGAGHTKAGGPGVFQGVAQSSRARAPRSQDARFPHFH